MNTRFLFLILTFVFFNGFSQPVSVQADYNSVGDCLFSAYNNSQVPMFLNINLADLENTTFNEPLPYVKKLEPGFTNLFTLQRDPDADVPRFNYEIKVYRSDPLAKVDLKYPYLFPFAEGRKVRVFDVKQIDGFWGQDGLSSWTATGFYAREGESVFACRNGIVVEVVGVERKGEAANWYNTWTNSVTLLQEDGTLICYHNIVDQGKTLKLGEKVYAGQVIGKIVNGAADLEVLVYHESLFSKYPIFVIPEFVISEERKGLVNSAGEYTVVHPSDIRSLEMSTKEKRKVLGKKK